MRRYEGPFKITKRVGKVAYKLEFPAHLKLHPVFHASMLKPYHEDHEDPERNTPTRAPIEVRASYDKEVEAILADRILRRKQYQPRHEYFVKWKGLPDSEASWEPADALWQFKDQIARFHAEDRDEGVTGTGGGE